MTNRPAFNASHRRALFTSKRRGLFELVLVALLIDVLLAIVWFGGVAEQFVGMVGFLVFWGIGLYVMLGLVMEPIRRWRRYE